MDSRIGASRASHARPGRRCDANGLRHPCPQSTVDRAERSRFRLAISHDTIRDFRSAQAGDAASPQARSDPACRAGTTNQRWPAPDDGSITCADTINEALARLPEHERDAISMHFFDGMTFRQMGEVLGLSRKGAKKRVARAMARLRAGFAIKGEAVAALATVGAAIRADARSNRGESGDHDHRKSRSFRWKTSEIAHRRREVAGQRNWCERRAHHGRSRRDRGRGRRYGGVLRLESAADESRRPARPTSQQKNKDLFSRLADRGEQVVGRISEIPGAKNLLDRTTQLTKRLDDVQKQLRGLGPLEKRVTSIEKRARQARGQGEARKRPATKRTTRDRARRPPKRTTGRPARARR